MKAIERLEALHTVLVRRDMYAQARDVNDIITELRRELPEAGIRTAWAAVVDTLYAVRPDWDETAGKSSLDNAVAAIRSMAAQCSAQPAPAATFDPLPAIPHEDIAAALYACDWSGVSIGNKVIIRAAIEALSRGYAPRT